MSSLYEKSQGTKIQITSVPATPTTIDAAVFLPLECSLKEAQFTAGQKQDIDVTTLCSDEQENINGLAAASEVSLSGNFKENPGQAALRDAYDNDTVYGFKIIFPSGVGFQFFAEVRQHTWSTGTNGVVAATFALRLKGKPTRITAPPAVALAFTTDLPATKTAAVGDNFSIGVVVTGGVPPYRLDWYKNGAHSGQGNTTTTIDFNNAQANESGHRQVIVTDAVGATIVSTVCDVEIS
ncbi:phage tail protein [Escherichia coli]|uniref:phage tail tube protein n=1 Tax=Escherichia coli TaxID=562 RepID=UPI000CACFD06|nr:phage tail tube protein [Escherichia coli]OZP06137.1 phage tail protein [Escherichia coli]